MRGEILHLVGGFPTIPLGYRLSRLLFLVSLNWSSSVLLLLQKIPRGLEFLAVGIAWLRTCIRGCNSGLPMQPGGSTDVNKQRIISSGSKVFQSTKHVSTYF